MLVLKYFNKFAVLLKVYKLKINYVNRPLFMFSFIIRNLKDNSKLGIAILDKTPIFYLFFVLLID